MTKFFLIIMIIVIIVLLGSLIKKEIDKRQQASSKHVPAITGIEEKEEPDSKQAEDTSRLDTKSMNKAKFCKEYCWAFKSGNGRKIDELVRTNQGIIHEIVKDLIGSYVWACRLNAYGPAAAKPSVLAPYFQPIIDSMALTQSFEDTISGFSFKEMRHMVKREGLSVSIVVTVSLEQLVQMVESIARTHSRITGDEDCITLVANHKKSMEALMTAKQAWKEGLKEGKGGLYRVALLKYQEALKLSREASEKEMEILVLGNIGVTYNQTEQYAEGLKCSREALKLLEEHPETFSENTRDKLIRDTLYNIGVEYVHLGDILALEYFKKARIASMNIGDNETAKKITKIIEILEDESK